METKTITAREMAAIKRIAQNSNLNVVKKNKLTKKLQSLQKEIADLESAIKLDEAGLIYKYGTTSENIVEKKVVATDKIDKDGNPIKITKYEPVANVVWDDSKKVFLLNIPEEKTEETTENNTTSVEEPTYDTPIFGEEGELLR